ncbi:uncharacterized protein ACA1_362950 [Acanthamoeba castellanii str. Neff]|uniref:Uncharacterized protein n=1 Tax=Acanthamoeba castellanii (strain ATCC 30010 / Neff) TaxID=1257118 RepID=L8GFM9_ACACF|nr:uncharacterized protein ACA1_362950 [Acanthamoeba castellanii str. Neff]ELR11807.1 hypothetical protein ACA1_362950 [Acanthamoeba castellanii str. Neff]
MRRTWASTPFKLWSAHSREWIRVDDSWSLEEIMRGADGTDKWEATPFSGWAYNSSNGQDTIQYNMLFGFKSNHYHPTGTLNYNVVWCVPRNITGDTHTWAKNPLLCNGHPQDAANNYRFKFVKPAGFAGGDIIEDGYPVHLYDTKLDKYCSNWIWPSNQAALLCDAAAPTSSGQRFNLHWA